MSLELERERTVQALCTHFAQDHLSTQELELRFDHVYKAQSADELQKLLRGLPALSTQAPVPVDAFPAPLYATAPAHSTLPEKRFLALMAEVRPKGLGVLPPRLKASAFMGAIRLDLREAQIPPGGVEIEASAIMGEVRIILPPGLSAEVDGLAIMGEFSDKTSFSTPGGPIVRVRGSSVMGSVRVETKLPKEGALDAWKRRLREQWRGY